MNLLTEEQEHINSVLDDKCLGWLMPILEIGQTTCKTFINLNSDFFNCKEYLNLVPGNLLSYSINKQIKVQSKLPSCPFAVHSEVINKRNKYCIPILKKADITISIMRSTSRKQIDSGDKKYLIKKCKKNNKLTGQLSINNMYDQFINVQENYHGILLYGSKKDWEGIEFADIVFFNSILKNECHSLNLIDKLRIYESTMSNSDKKKNILNAKNLIKDAVKDLGDD